MGFTLLGVDVLISLFNKETSGTISIKTKTRGFELDVKHSYDWYQMPYWRYKDDREFTFFIPFRVNCAGWRVSLYKRN